MGYKPLNGKGLGPPWRKCLALRPSGREGFWPMQNFLYNPIPHRNRNPFPHRDRNPLTHRDNNHFAIEALTLFPLIPFPMRGPNLLLITLN